MTPDSERLMIHEPHIDVKNAESTGQELVKHDIGRKKKKKNPREKESHSVPTEVTDRPKKAKRMKKRDTRHGKDSIEKDSYRPTPDAFVPVSECHQPTPSEEPVRNSGQIRDVPSTPAPPPTQPIRNRALDLEAGLQSEVTSFVFRRDKRKFTLHRQTHTQH